jgi:hypothetical protein
VWQCTACEEVNCETNPNDAVCVQDSSCIGCHGLASSESSGGIENSHPWSYVGCTGCHGGVGRDPNDPTRALSKEESHVPLPPAMAVNGSTNEPNQTTYSNYYLARAGVEALEGGLDWLQFINPDGERRR